MADIIVGQSRRIAWECRTLDGDLTDPSSITFKMQHKGPLSARNDVYIYGTDDEVVRDSAGKYHIDIWFDTHGDWKYRIVCAGVVNAAAQDTLYVAPANQ